MHNVVFHETIVPHNQLCTQIKTGINCGWESRIMAELRPTRESSFSECVVESSRKRIPILPLAKRCKTKEQSQTSPGISMVHWWSTPGSRNSWSNTPAQWGLWMRLCCVLVNSQLWLRFLNSFICNSSLLSSPFIVFKEAEYEHWWISPSPVFAWG